MIQEWNEAYGIPERLEFACHASGLEIGKVSSEHCRAMFFLHGAHLAEFQRTDQRTPLLFMSEKAMLAPDKPIRGGVPICFPWFGAHPTVPTHPAHGTARITTWEILETALIEDDVLVRLGLHMGGFLLSYEMRFGKSLELALEVRSATDDLISFEVALHTYFLLGDVHRTNVRGLEEVPFLDQLTGQIHAPAGEPIRFVEETDRIYQGTVSKLSLHDQGNNRTIWISPTDSESTIVWNPWIAKSQRMADFGDEEYLRMCCIETANVRDRRVTLQPGMMHTTGVKIDVLEST